MEEVSGTPSVPGVEGAATVSRRARSFGGHRVRFIDWRTKAHKGARLPKHIRWAPGSPDTLIIESFRRRYRLALRLRRV